MCVSCKTEGKLINMRLQKKSFSWNGRRHFRLFTNVRAVSVLSFFSLFALLSVSSSACVSPQMEDKREVGQRGKSLTTLFILWRPVTSTALSLSLSFSALLFIHECRSVIRVNNSVQHYITCFNNTWTSWQKGLFNDHSISRANERGKNKNEGKQLLSLYFPLILFSVRAHFFYFKIIWN